MAIETKSPTDDELRAPEGKVRVIKTGLVGHHDYHELVKDCASLEEALELTMIGNNVRGGAEIFFAYNDQGQSVGQGPSSQSPPSDHPNLGYAPARREVKRMY